MSTLRTVVLAGASGFMGRHLAQAFAGDGVTVRTIGRSGADATWQDDLTGLLEGADAVVNLAGRSVSCRYTKATIDEIFSSRTQTTAALGRAIARCDAPPPVWVNASTGTIYRDARDRPQDEVTGELGTGFSVEVARAWERELFTADAPGVRRVALRTSIVLGNGGALNAIVNLARLGAGGHQGDGGQVFSWIHLHDVYRAVRHVLAEDRIAGPVNLATPHPVTNAELMRTLRAHVGGLGERVGVPTPAWMLGLGGRVIRTEPELVLKSRWVHPEVLLDSGFTWEFGELDAALADIARTTPRGLLPVQLG
ncbi:TIGR01777 family oxidoreductase [Kytococcus sedentarius]|uniref:TIGR01777 family oxidoreductase n=1 Tax=Kytococcus sedentarius TaxID=1276 RepID=UPI0035BBBBD7